MKKRLEKAVSFSDLGKATKIPSFLLKRYEEGTAYPGENKKKRLIEVLDIFPEEYRPEEDLGYPYLWPEEKKERLSLSSLLEKKLTRLLSFLLALLSFIFFFLSLQECIPYHYDVTPFFASNLFDVRDEIMSDGEQDGDAWILTEDNGISYCVPSSKKHVGESAVTYTLEDGDALFQFRFFADTFNQRLDVINLDDSKDNKVIFHYILNYYEDDILLETIENEALESNDSFLTNITILSLYPAVTKTIDETMSIRFSIRLFTFLDNLRLGQYQCYSHESESYYITFLVGTIYLVSAAVFLLSLFSLNRRSRFRLEGGEDVLGRFPLPRDWPIAPLIKEYVFLVLSLLLFFFCQLSPFLVFSNLFGLYHVPDIPNIDAIISFLKGALPLANVLILFLNLHRKILGDRAFSTAVTYLFAGALFTTLECLLIYDLSRAQSFFLNLLVGFFPSNLFLPMGLFALLSSSLFSKPAFLERHPLRKVAFRLLALSLMNNEQWTKTLGLTGYLYLPLLVPFILLFCKNIGKRKPAMDLFAGVFYFASNVLSYLLIFLTMSG